MRKSILALAAVAAAATFATAQSADARGLRVGFGFGMGSGGLSPLADSSILERARRQQEKNAYGGRTYQAAPSYAAASARAIERRRAAAAASAAVAEKRQAAAAASRARAEQAAADQAARRKAAAARKIDVVKAPVVEPAQTATASTSSNSDKALEAAQQEQRAKAEELLRKLGGGQPLKAAEPATSAPVVQPASRVVVAPVSDPQPIRTQAAPVTTPAVTPAAAGGDCRRFIPGAGVTVQVPCSE